MVMKRKIQKDRTDTLHEDITGYGNVICTRTGIECFNNRSS